MSYQCQSCGYKSLKWLGRCPECGAWNSFLEEKEERASKKRETKPFRVLKLAEVSYFSKPRISTGLSEFDLVLGGGIVPASLILIGGDPGIGKSTLLTQMAGYLTEQGKRVLYFSAEESPEQVKLRTKRLQIVEDFYFLSETDLSLLFEVVEEIKPEVIIVDSIQTVYLPELASSPGSVSQVRECANQLLRLAKEKDISIFLVGHITKEGVIAGPKILEHLVDVVLYLEGERETGFRILRAMKNRFGAVNEIGVFVMTEAGLKSHSQYEELFLTGKGAPFCILEGTRPLIVEVQALTSKSYLSLPRRQSVGYDPIRLSLLCAILEKRLGLSLGDKDVYVKVAGGLRITDPSADLAISVSLLSSLFEKELPQKTLYIGEIGLSGELRPVRDLTLRLKEAEKKGFKKALVPDYGKIEINSKTFEIYPLKSLQEVLKLLFGL
ncbi:DNA repair protein RadA [Caldimicrobium thiodismutans]|uniref:DNA repair protein RadA n=1 Tax=Caldimicrobium thiodismutans TaxID=1653476 RepID=A0A0U5AY39_9BACT|nr:DNA repair protein RadA [Caldimicrobium thiodismutans]BAU23582.1 DNA repair protein RadA [Caldimicrobium thiodismutans]